MNWLEELRKKYGLQQEELAVYLAASRTTISMAEINKRDLPTEAMLLLAPLLTNSTTLLTGELAQQLAQKQQEDAAQADKQAQQQLLQSRAKLARARKKLATMQEKQQQALQAIQLAERIKTWPIEAKHTQRRDVFFNTLLANAFVTLSNNGLAAQAALQTTIRMHEMIVGEAG